MTPNDRIAVDARAWHPGLVFYQDRETRDTIAVDRASGAIVGSYRGYGDSQHGMSSELIQAALRYVPGEGA